MSGGADERTRAALGLCWVAASGCRAPLGLLHRMSPEALWRAARAGLIAAGLSPAAAARFIERRRACPPDSLSPPGGGPGEVRRSFLPLGHEHYPKPFLQLDAPPAGIFLEGDQAVWPELLRAPRVTIVGTRRASGYGIQVADAVARRFARAGVVVVSGLALGIDGRAHQAALASAEPTVAIVGSGTDVVYPRRHRDLRTRVMRTGLVIGELPPGTPPSPWTFPLRNRLLAAFGDAVVVIEAGARSGALITVDAAAELGRPVFAVPGSILGEGHVGCNRLLYDGASPLVDPDEALEDFLRLTRTERGDRVPRTQVEGNGRRTEGGSVAGEDTVARLLVLALERRPLTVDEAAAAVGATVEETAAALALLEVAGTVVRSGPGRFRRL